MLNKLLPVMIIYQELLNFGGRDTFCSVWKFFFRQWLECYVVF